MCMRSNRSDKQVPRESSREAAKEFSPRRKPWEQEMAKYQAPEERKKLIELIRADFHARQLRPRTHFRPRKRVDRHNCIGHQRHQIRDRNAASFRDQSHDRR